MMNLASCQKENTPKQTANNTITIELDCETMTKVALNEVDGIVKATWETGDYLEVWERPEPAATNKFSNLDMSKVSKMELVSGAGKNKATFRGIFAGTLPEELNVIYRKNTNNNAFRQNTNGSFQCSGNPQLLTSDLNEAPLILAGVFKKSGESTYVPADGMTDGKMVYGGALFKITMQGLTPNTKIKTVTYKVATTDKFIGAASTFSYKNDVFTSTGAMGLKNGSTQSNGEVTTGADGNVTIYSFIMPQGYQSNGSDFDVYVTYESGNEVKVGTIKFIDKQILLGKCYSLTLTKSDE